MPLKMLGTMPRRKQLPPETTGFGRRLVELRKQRGLTQVQLAEAICSTQRAISYYENEAGYPPVPAIASLAKALNVSADELIGVKRVQRKSELETPEMRRLWKKLQQVAELPEKDQRVVVRLINSLAQVNGLRKAS